MLIMTFKELPDEETLQSQSKVFNGIYYDEWLDMELVKKMIIDVDKTKPVSRTKFISPILGEIPVTRLSSGVKGLILMLCEEELRRSRYFRSSGFGQNCFKWIFYMSTFMDVKLQVNSYFHVPEDLPTDKEYKVYFEDYDYTTTDLKDIDYRLIYWG